MKWSSPMRTTMFLLLTVAACGGKTTSTDPSGAQPAVDPAADPAVRTTESAPPGDRDLDGEEACRITCAHFATCGSPDAECLSRCHADLSEPVCGEVATSYFTCFAAREEQCGAVALPCRSAACAYAKCKGQELPSYCC